MFTIAAGQITTIQGDFEAMGNLRVMTSPAVPATVYVDDIPRNAWGLWVYIPAGTCVVSFGDVPGLVSPAPMEVVVSSGEYTPVTGVFGSM